MSLSPGTRLGPYEVIAPVGAGGMGEVFRARDTRLDRQVAIKILPAELAQNAQLKLRFEREAKAISQLSHPNICTLYDVGDGYLVMELLEGETVADRVAKGPLPISEVLKIGAQIADALDRAHKAGIVHRDLKPSNVMLTKSGAKLLDFGLAKDDSGLRPQASGLTVQKPLTEEGTILGTYHYMAPEQLAGEEADARSDIFSFGALLYEMVTGHRAFDGKTKTSIITSIVSRDPSPVCEVQPMTPPALEHIIRKCLSKDPDDRWQSAHDIATQLRWISDSGSAAGLAAPVLRTRRSRERLLWIAALIAVAAGALFTAAKLHLGETPHTYRFAIPMAGAIYHGGNVRISPDGQTIYFQATPDGQHVLVFRRRLDEIAATPIEGTEGAYSYGPSADGHHLYLFFPGAVMKRIDVNGGPAETITDGEKGVTAGFTESRDGTMLFGLDTLPINRLLPNHTVEPVTTLDTAHGETGHASPFFLPDGKTFLFVSLSHDLERGTVRKVLCSTRLGSKEITRIGDISSGVEYAAGNLFFVRGGTLMAQLFDARRLKLTGEPVALANDVDFDGHLTRAAFAVAENGTVAYQNFSAGRRLNIVDGTGKLVKTIAPSAIFGVGRFSLFPDGSRVVVPVDDHHTGIRSLWVYGLERDTATRLTFSRPNESVAVIARDGSRIFFASDAQGPSDIYGAPPDGSTPPRPVVAAPGLQVPNDVSPDGKFLLYTTNEHAAVSKQDLYVLPLTAGAKPRPFLVTPAIENNGVFSPGGKWVAYTSDLTGTFQVFVRPFPGPGAARQVSTKGGSAPRFARDGRHIYFVDASTQLMSAEFHADGSTTEPALKFDWHDQIASYEPLEGDRFMVLSETERDASKFAEVIVGWHP